MTAAHFFVFEYFQGLVWAAARSTLGLTLAPLAFFALSITLVSGKAVGFSE